MLTRPAEAKLFAPLALFGHSGNDDAEEWGDGLLEAMVGAALPVLQDGANLVARLQLVVKHLVRQVRGLLHPSSRFAGGFREAKLGPVAGALGDALRALLGVDLREHAVDGSDVPILALGRSLCAKV